MPRFWIGLGWWLAVTAAGAAPAPEWGLEFDDPADWQTLQRVQAVEGWGADQLAQAGVADGRLTLVPHSSVWYRDYRGELAFRPVNGDFVLTAALEVSGRQGGPPRSRFSLAGLLVRAPRDITPQTWRAGGENYVFLSLGSADQPGNWQWEVKTTVNSNSDLRTEPAAGGRGEVRLARVGSALILLRRAPGQPWVVHQRYRRPDLPSTLQAGLTVYTDWDTCSRLQPFEHNRQVIRGGNPDLVARCDYLRCRRPQVPPALAGADLSSPAVPDAALLAFLGDSLDTAAANPGTPMAAGPPATASEPPARSDEFDNPATHVNWLRIEQVEGSTANQLLAGDINQTRPGWLTLVPRAVVWYRDWRGPLLHQRVTGDFVVTARLAITNRAGTGAPQSQFSLAGLLVRAPRQVTPQTWTPGGENYVFLSLGAADRPGSYQWETKTTVNSDSQLRLIPAPGGEGEVRIARVGPHLLLLRREPGGAWQVHQRYHRPDFPAELQVGLTCYTDWPTASATPPAQHNFMALNGGNPDLRAQVDYIRFARPPAAVTASALDLSDPASVPEAALLRWFGGD